MYVLYVFYDPPEGTRQEIMAFIKNGTPILYKV